MARLRIRIELSRGGAGVPLRKLASVIAESQKFLNLLTEDVRLDKQKGEWLGFDFDCESLNFTAEYVGPVTAPQVEAFTTRPSTAPLLCGAIPSANFCGSPSPSGKTRSLDSVCINPRMWRSPRNGGVFRVETPCASRTRCRDPHRLLARIASSLGCRRSSPGGANVRRPPGTEPRRHPPTASPTRGRIPGPGDADRTPGRPSGEAFRLDSGSSTKSLR